MFRKIIFFNLIITILLSSQLVSQTQVSGSVSGTWTKANSPYIAVGGIKIEEGDTLIIEPGVQVLFDGNFEFSTYGYLFAVGTETDSIIFTHYQKDSLWSSINISKEGNESILEYCRIEYSNHGGIKIYDATPTIRHCHILNNTNIGSTGYAGFGGGIEVKYADPLIEFNVIENNFCKRGGGIHIYEDPSDRPTVCRIFNNIIRNNSGKWGGGIRVFTEAGFTAGAKCTPIIRNNILDGNSVPDSIFGGNLYVFPGARPQIINNIIINSPSGSGLLDLSNSIIKYNNVWNNKPYDYVDTSPGIGDISTDPLFAGGAPYSYYFTQNSPCIDTGDPDSPFDPDNTRADIGAFYYGADLPPIQVTDLNAVSSDSKITLIWQNPYLIDYNYTVVIRNNDTYPQNTSDGTKIFEGTQTMCQDNGLNNGQTYYYGVFVYDKAGFVSIPAQISAKPELSSISIIRVPWDYLKIQDALDAAQPGDTVLVFPGRYSPSTNNEVFPITMADSVVLMSKDGRVSTIIDAEHTNLVIMGANNAIIEGFTITNGFNTSIHGNPNNTEPTGGGILCLNVTNMKIIDNKITRNEANGQYLWDGKGGGIYSWESNVVINGNEISYNKAGRKAGGVFCTGTNSYPRNRVKIIDNEIIWNYECGIVIDTWLKALIQGNFISENRICATGWNIPAGIYIQGEAKLYNNTIVNNRNCHPGTMSGVHIGGNAILINNIVGGHSTEGGVEIGFEEENFWRQKPVVKYCLIQNGFPGKGNLANPPGFVGGSPFDFHLSEKSPCIDAGDPEFPLDPDGTRADIGAYYFHHTDIPRIESQNDQFVIYINQGQDTTITFSFSNSGNRDLNYKFFDERGNNLEGASQPDEYGYAWIDSDNPNGPEYLWFEIDSIGGYLETSSKWFVLPFNFYFYDIKYDSVNISCYGYVSFNKGSSDMRDKIPDAGRPNNLIAVFWDKLYRDSAVRPKSIYGYTSFSDKNFIAEWQNMVQWSDRTVMETFEAILKPTGTIYLMYREINYPHTAVVGIENATGQFGLQVAYNEDYLHDSLAVAIFRGAYWLEIPSFTGTIEPDESKELSIKINSKTLQPGFYEAHIVIESNGPENATIKIPVHLNVNPSGGDLIVPLPITDLSIKNISEGKIGLIWTATGDDSISGVASEYDIRYQTHEPSSDTTLWWQNATKTYHSVTPSVAGKKDSVIISELSTDSTYYFAIKIGDEAGNWSDISNIVYTSFPTVVNHVDIIPRKFELSQNYPNPFNPVTTIKYQLPRDTHITLNVYNAMGQEIVKLVDEHKQAGYHSVNWDAKEMASGLYFYQIKAGEFEQVKKMLLLQ